VERVVAATMASRMQRSSLQAMLLLFGLAEFAESTLAVPNLIGDRGDVMIASKADINFGFMTSFHVSSDNIRNCDTMRASACTTALPSLRFALRDLNRRADVLPNITVGFVAVDDCGTPIRALEVSSYFVDDNAAIDGSGCSSNSSGVANVSSSDTTSRDVVAVIGLGSSTVASLASSFLGVFQTPHISTYATSDLLSDKTIYEYFLRLVSPDTFQVRAMLDLCQHMGWTYVSMVYSEGSYGENAASKINYYLRRANSEYTICLATSQKLYNDATTADINAILLQLTTLERVNVVILFLSGVHQLTFLDSARQVAGKGRFLWLAGDFFIKYFNSPYVDMVDGGIYLNHPSVEMPDFALYMESIRPASYGDKWLSEFWEVKENCNLWDKFNITGRGCWQDAKVTPDVCPYSWPLTCRIYDAVQVLGDAIHRLITDRCPRAFSEKWMLNECISGPVLLKYLYETDIVGRIGRIQFDNNGAIQESLQYCQCQKLATGYASVLLGQWNPFNGSLTLDSEAVSWTAFRYWNYTDINTPLTSVCSLPCKTNEYVIVGEVSCCWSCRSCRNNEIVSSSQTACQLCPMFYWPDDNGTSCTAIESTYLHLSHPISICLLVMAAVAGTLGLTVLTIYMTRRRQKLLMATNITLSIVILLGTLAVDAAIVVFAIAPNLDGICTVRSYGFHCGINLIYAPLSVKNVLTYRVFTAGAQKKIAFKSKKSQMMMTASCFAIQVCFTTFSTI
jgi:hypothetical protein